MKPASQIIIFILSILTSMTYAASPREELAQMVEQLQKTPTDNALREKIIKLAGEVKPAPALSKEALRHVERGTLALKNATTKQGYLDAAHEYKQASLLAPWAADIYHHLGIAYEKAGDVAVAGILTGSKALKTCSSDDRAREWERFNLYSLSKQYFKWYLLARLDAPDAEMVKHRIAEHEVKHRIAERELTIAHWQYEWDRKCCVGCGGTQRNPR